MRLVDHSKLCGVILKSLKWCEIMEINWRLLLRCKMSTCMLIQTAMNFSKSVGAVHRQVRNAGSNLLLKTEVQGILFPPMQVELLPLGSVPSRRRLRWIRSPCLQDRAKDWIVNGTRQFQ